MQLSFYRNWLHKIQIPAHETIPGITRITRSVRLCHHESNDRIVAVTHKLNKFQKTVITISNLSNNAQYNWPFINAVPD